ncbi:sulfatase family protein [Dysgonomonas termitidis]|uniref:Sulfatase n=1 Tax=Dysgonomonas termitidis TaxID=1516126 RepID=A0ABV9L1N9_9BACT
MKNSPLYALLGISACICNEVIAQGTKKPMNILFIMTDDHAFQALSAYGHPISKLAPTPNLDRIAQNGMLFNNAFVENSISTPSRATLLTGMYSHQHGQTHLGYGLKPDKKFFVEYLQDAGYQTALFGKWHLSAQPKGFDTYKIFDDQGEYYNPRFRTPQSDGKYIREEGYATDLVTDDALNWLIFRDKSKPFCVLVHHKAPHRNWMPDLQYLDLYEDIEFPEPATLFDDYSTRGEQMKTHELSVASHLGYAFDLKVSQLQNEPTLDYIKSSFDMAISTLTPEQLRVWNESYDKKNKDFLANRPQGKELVRWKYQRYIKDYCRTIKSVDVQVGRLLDYLENNNLMENTIIVYTSDQGFYLGEHGLYDKRFMYEEAFRTPLIIALPGAKKGAECTELVQNIDYAPTLLDAAGVNKPDDMAGESLIPLLTGTSDKWRDNLYYQFYDYPAVGMTRKHYGIRDKRYKLIHWYGKGELKDKDIDSWELYDLKKDPTEIINIYNDKKYTKVKERLHILLEQKRRELKVTE